MEFFGRLHLYVYYHTFSMTMQKKVNSSQKDFPKDLMCLIKKTIKLQTRIFCVAITYPPTFKYPFKLVSHPYSNENRGSTPLSQTFSHSISHLSHPSHLIPQTPNKKWGLNYQYCISFIVNLFRVKKNLESKIESSKFWIKVFNSELNNE